MEVILRKTALLFQAAAHTAAVLATRDSEIIHSMRQYGRDFGLAYQLVDDWLDYEGDSAVMGKNIGDDLAEGKATLPLIRTMKYGCPEDAALVRDALETRCPEALSAVRAAVRRSGALDYTRDRAVEFAARSADSLARLPANIYREALEALASFAVARMR